MRVAAIDSNRGLLTARGPGKARITVRSLTLTASIEVAVMQDVVELKVEPGEAMFTAIGDSVRVVATAMDQNGHPIVEAVVAWSSSDEAVATVSDSGWVFSIGNGTAQVTAQSGSIEENVDVTVLQAATSIVLGPEEAWAVTVGDTIRLAAVVLDRNEHPIEEADMEWSSSDETVATVGPDGLVTATGEGSARVSVRSGDAEAIARFVVSAEEAGPDLQAMIALYNATDGPNWSNNTNWLSGEPLGTWHGIDTDQEGRIWSLWLPENEMSGRLPRELGQLSGLTVINLYNNQLSGDIPSALGELKNLKLLYLGLNRLTGEIPAELGQLENLEGLKLENNQLTGAIPAELGRMESLTSLGISNNQLSGEIPAELGRLKKLNDLDLYNNRLTGGIPSELGQISQLTFLSLALNRLTGDIPSEIGQMQKLESLYLTGNSLSGEIPPELGQLEQLQVLSLSNNRLTGSIPSELGRLSHLVILDLGVNRLTEAIPPDLGALEHLEKLQMPWNGLTGEIPPNWGGSGNSWNWTCGITSLRAPCLSRSVVWSASKSSTCPITPDSPEESRRP